MQTTRYVERRGRLAASVWTGLLAGAAVAAWPLAASAATACADMVVAKLPNVAITAAQPIPAGTYQPPGSTVAFTDLPAFCRITATVSPVTGSSIGIEVWLPSAWNGRYQQVGNHGWAGVIYWSEMAPQLRRGFATGATDNGHVNPTSNPFYIDWAIGQPVRIEDMAWRAVHELADNAKRLIALFYDERLRAAYFNGCSDGGREALREAHDFPGDFDGIIAGGAAAYWTHAATQQLELTLNLRNGGIQGDAGSAVLSLAQQAATAACDAADGVADGLIADPTRCLWNPHSIVCQPGAAPASCITPAQADALQAITGPMRDPHTGTWLFSGIPEGSEFELIRWKYTTGLAPFGLSNYRIARGDPGWDGAGFDLSTDLPRLDAALGVMNMTDTDLRPFAARGGKLIQYHGWNDGAFTPGWTTAYYDAVARDLGHGNPAGVQDFYRLFMMPGVGHCSPPADIGPDNIGTENQTAVAADAEHDVVTALQRWVEQGVAPERLVATRFRGNDPKNGIQMQRPIYPYPAQAVWTGTGSANDAGNFRSSMPNGRDPNAPDRR